MNPLSIRGTGGTFFADYKTAFTEITRLRDRRLIVKRNYSTPILEQWDW